MAAMAAAPLHPVITATVPTARIDRIEGVLSTCFVGVRFRPTCNRSCVQVATTPVAVM